MLICRDPSCPRGQFTDAGSRRGEKDPREQEKEEKHQCRGEIRSGEEGLSISTPTISLQKPPPREGPSNLSPAGRARGGEQA